MKNYSPKDYFKYAQLMIQPDKKLRFEKLMIL